MEKMAMAWIDETANRFVYVIDMDKSRKEEEEMGLLDGFLCWVGRTTTLKWDRKMGKETNIYRWG